MADHNQREREESPSPPRSSSNCCGRFCRCSINGSQPGPQPDNTGTGCEIKIPIPGLSALSYYRYHPSPWTNLDLGGVGVFPVSIKLISSFERQHGEVRSMAAGPNGILYTGSCSKNIRVWNKGNADTGFNALNGPIYALLLDQQGRVFSSHHDGTVRVWERNASMEITWYKRITSLPTMKDRFKSMFRRRNNKLTSLYWHDFPVSCISLSKDMEFLYSGSWDHTMKIWRVQDWRLIDSIPHRERVSAVAAGSDGLVFSGSSDGSLSMWKREEDGTKHTFVQYLLSGGSTVNTLMLRYNNENGTSGGELYAGLSNGAVMFWKEAAHWYCPEVLPYDHKNGVSCIADSSGPLVFSGSVDGRICVWRRKHPNDSHALVMVLMAHEGPVNCLAAHDDWEESKDGTSRCVLYSGSEDKTLKTWRVAGGALEDAQFGL